MVIIIKIQEIKTTDAKIQDQQNQSKIINTVTKLIAEYFRLIEGKTSGYRTGTYKFDITPILQELDINSDILEKIKEKIKRECKTRPTCDYDKDNLDKLRTNIKTQQLLTGGAINMLNYKHNL